jgi:D-alanyl-D-alanine carboxypeptidase
MRTFARFGSAVSAIALSAMLGGCAASLSRGSAEGPKPGDPDFALATRALVALESNDVQTAISLAERAVELSPDDSTVRTLLADSYFASGRFASAESAYRDSLSLAPVQPKAILKLALVKIALGKSEEALGVLGSAQRVLDPADYGLAVALAGRPGEAVAILDNAARAPRADARVRQNLALAHALAGDWMAARVVAEQDLPAPMVDSRIQQWMALANPARPSDQVAALVGVSPAAADPGQPVKLALHPQQAPAALAQVAPVPQAEPAFVSAPVAEAPAPAPMPVAEAPAVEIAAALPPVPQPQIAADPVEPEARYVPPTAASFETKAPKSAPAPVAAAILEAEREAAPKPRNASLPRKSGNSGYVVQLGAYSSAGRVEVAWEKFADEFASLRGYIPSSARFDSSRGTVYRLSVKGFGTLGEATELCSALREKGKACFVRKVAGDTPVRFASR